VKESYIQRKVCEYAKNTGWLTIKIHPMYSVGFPDVIAYSPNGKMVHLEFKTPTGKLSKVQTAMHEQLTTRGATVLVVTSIEQGKEVINNYNCERV